MSAVDITLPEPTKEQIDGVKSLEELFALMRVTNWAGGSGRFRPGDMTIHFLSKMRGFLVDLRGTGRPEAQFAKQACDAVVEALRGQASNGDVATWACETAAYLAKDHSENTARLVSADICEALVQAMQACDPLGRDLKLAVTGCAAMSALAAAGRDVDASSRLGDCGACEVVAAVLRGLSSIEQIAREGCRAAAALAAGHNDNKARLLAAGAREAIEAFASNAKVEMDKGLARTTLEVLKG